MTSRAVEMPESMPEIRQRKRYTPAACSLVSRLAGSRAMSEAVATRVRFNASPRAVWNHLMFYEEVPGRAPFLLRLLLPHPLRTEGDKGCVGTTVRCIYRGGYLLKRITAVEPSHFLRFEVFEQRLGIENCVVTRGGSYQLYGNEDTTEVVLTTNYQAYLRPRRVWHLVESFFIGQLHRHVLQGISLTLLPGNPPLRLAEATQAPRCTPKEGLACTISQSDSRH